MRDRNVELGLGLIGIGREWGYISSLVPDELQVQDFLMSAYHLNIRFYDTAPSYGKSEKRLGTFLGSLSKEQRDKIVITTKFGEHWDNDANCAFTDHSYDALRKSIDQSLALLGSIDVLQLHKPTPQVLESKNVFGAIEYAKSCGIKSFGASVSDSESGKIVCECDMYSFMQLPYNACNINFEGLMDLGIQNNKRIIVNRPFWMGKILHQNEEADLTFLKIKAFEFIVNKNFNGIILTGTKNINHLDQNIQSFKAAINLHDKYKENV